MIQDVDAALTPDQSVLNFGPTAIRLQCRRRRRPAIHRTLPGPVYESSFPTSKWVYETSRNPREIPRRSVSLIRRISCPGGASSQPLLLHDVIGAYLCATRYVIESCIAAHVCVCVVPRSRCQTTSRVRFKEREGDPVSNVSFQRSAGLYRARRRLQISAAFCVHRRNADDVTTLVGARCLCRMHPAGVLLRVRPAADTDRATSKAQYERARLLNPRE